ncbi:MAG TPA: amidohydrolase family protein, partial [Agromyces sp.]
EGAWAWHAEDSLGVLRVGARADLVTWSSNLYDLERDPTRLLGERADLTIVAGEIVHDAADAEVLAEPPPVGMHHCSAA